MYACPMEEKPKCCSHCNYYNISYRWCLCQEGQLDCDVFNEIDKDCPLIEAVSKEDYDVLFAKYTSLIAPSNEDVASLYNKGK